MATRCQRCESDRLFSISGKTSDMFSGTAKDRDYDGYVPSGMGIGGGDYIRFEYCLECGQIQDKFPVPDLPSEEEEDDLQNEEEDNEW